MKRQPVIEVEIDRIVLEGVELDARGVEHLRISIADRLTEWLSAASDVPSRSQSIARATGPSVVAADRSSTADLASGIVTAIREAVSPSGDRPR